MDDELKKICNEVLCLCSEIIGHSGQFLPNELLATALALKVRNSVSCAMKLLDEEFVHDGYILLRTMAEATIYCCESLRNPSFCHDFHKAELDRAKRLTDKICKLEMVKSGKVPKEIQDRADEMKRAFVAYSGLQPDQNLQTLANSNDCVVEYYYFHSLGSAFVHSLPNVMGSYVHLDDTNKQVDFIQMPDQDKTLDVLSGCGYCLLKVAAVINNHFKMNHETDIVNIRQRYLAAIDTRIQSIKTQQ